MSHHRARLIASVAFALAAFYWSVNPAPLPAQTVSGTILGQIQDQQGAGIGKAEVSARNLDTGAIRKTTADDAGAYRITGVPAGSYEVSAAIAGFKTEVRTGINVTVGSDVAVSFSMTVGAVSEKVEVTAEAPQVDATSSTLGGFVNSATIRELPLNGRDWLQLALLQPGVNINNAVSQDDTSRAQRGAGLSISISGGRPTDNAFRIDGVIVNDYSNSGPGSNLHVNMGVDAIREFSVLTNNYSAEYGRGSGGIVNAITKSGTNQIHGSAYEFVRNSAFDARNFFDGNTLPPFHRDQYGGAVGGPIRKDKTFFFTNYEKLGEVKSLSANDPTLSANARNGILCANTACTQTTQVAINPRVKPYLAFYPLPNGPVTGDTGKFLFNPKRLGEEGYVIGKIDHYFSAATTFFGTYSYDNETLSTPDNYNLKSTSAPSRRQNVVLSLQHIFSPSLISNTRAGVTRSHAGDAIDCCANPNYPQLTDPALGFGAGRLFGSLNVGGVAQGKSGGQPRGVGSSGANIFGYTAPQVFEDLSWTKGRHSVRTGFNFERIDYNAFSGNSPLGVWTFTSIPNFLAGIPSQFSSDLPPGSDFDRSERMSVFGGYIQDDFRMRSNLTFNLGLRYEMGTVISENYNKIANLRNLTDSQPALGSPFYNNPTLKNFAPRFGFAWDPFKNGKTAVRGGFGMFDIVPLPYLFITRMPASAPFVRSGFVNNPPPSSFPNQVLQLMQSNSLQVEHIGFNPSRIYRMQWNLNIQRQLTSNLALTLGYLGSSAVHLAHPIEDADVVPASLVHFDTASSSYIFPIPAAGTSPQRINPNFGRILSTEWSGQSNYHALQANLVQRPIKGLTYQIAYTWSKSIDNGSGTYGEGENVNGAAAGWAFDPRLNRGVSDFNVPQNFVLNFQYDLPVPAAMKTHAFTNTIFSGWQVGGIYTRQSGGPFTLRLSSDRAFTGNSLATASKGAQQPMYVNAPGCSSNAVTGDIGNYIMTQCFAFPAPGQLGNMGRNTLRLPVFRDLDFSVFKNQNLWGERLKAQFRAEMFNILNNTNLSAQIPTIFDGSGKLITSVGAPVAPTAGTSRQIQIGLRLLF